MPNHYIHVIETELMRIKTSPTFFVFITLIFEGKIFGKLGPTRLVRLQEGDMRQ